MKRSYNNIFFLTKICFDKNVKNKKLIFIYIILIKYMIIKSRKNKKNEQVKAWHYYKNQGIRI